MTVQLHQDPGLQPERTNLAWSRTGMALVLVGLLHLRFVGHFGPVVLPVLGIVGVVALVTSMTGRRRYRRRVRGIREESLQPAARSVLLLGGSVLLLGTCTLLIILLRG
ncbi:DUF202 domain-containing protein [Naumannella sp. ID2617S]|nr:DUF202 domain-containing protein [Naumannella sp. ID2617S]